MSTARPGHAVQRLRTGGHQGNSRIFDAADGRLPRRGRKGCRVTLGSRAIFRKNAPFEFLGTPTGTPYVTAPFFGVLLHPCYCSASKVVHFLRRSADLEALEEQAQEAFRGQDTGPDGLPRRLDPHDAEAALPGSVFPPFLLGEGPKSAGASFRAPGRVSPRVSACSGRTGSPGCPALPGLPRYCLKPGPGDTALEVPDPAGDDRIDLDAPQEHRRDPGLGRAGSRAARHQRSGIGDREQPPPEPRPAAVDRCRPPADTPAVPPLRGPSRARRTAAVKKMHG